MSYIYNIALDMFMEKKVDLLRQIVAKKDVRKLYYNIHDKEYILYKIDPSLAKQIWNDLQNNIYILKKENLSTYTCPFCIETIVKSDELNCGICSYRMNHNGFHCEDLNSDFRKITGNKLIRIPYSTYIDIMSEISRELF